jgi:ribonuclease III
MKLQPISASQKMRNFEKKIGYRFKKKGLLTLALTHRSFAHESGNLSEPDNERLEFLGDSVLGLVIAELAYRRFPKISEGTMTQTKSNLVSRAALSKKALQVGLGPVMRLGKGQQHAGRSADSILSCGLEALIGAIYLDGGLKPTALFIQRIIWPKKTRRPRIIKNNKEKLQKYFLRHHQCLPRYKVTGQKGPAHQKEFTMAVTLRGRTLAKGKRRAKMLPAMPSRN